MTPIRRALALALGLLVLVPAAASAWRSPPASATKPFFDSRASTRASSSARGANARSSAAPVRARTALRNQLGRQGVLSIDPLTGTPRQLARTDGALSSPRAGARTTIALDFLRTNRTALGLSSADLDGLSLYRQASTARGLTVVHFQQVFRGIPAFDNGVRVAIDRAGRVMSVTGSPRHELSVASVDPALSGADALARLQRNVGESRSVPVRSGPSGVRLLTRFATGDFARLVLFGTADGARLAWHVTYRSAATTALYDAVVDATRGAILYRANLTKDASNADIYRNHPGAAPAETVDLEETADPDDQDLGLPAAAPDLSVGTFSSAWSDINDNDAVDTAPDDERIVPSGGTDFQYAFTPFAVNAGCTATLPCAWDPADRDSWRDNRAQNGVQAYYLVSHFHNHLADPEIGFTDDWGSFEVGGTGGDDPVLTQTDDGANTDGNGGPDANHSNNANMLTPPDGESPRMQMYLFTDTNTDALDFRDMNGGDDSGVVWHEYTHGLSNRLVINDDGSGAVNTAQAGAMGEAWSDWYASDNQVREGLKSDALATPGEIDVGAYSDRDLHTLRSQALDCPVGLGDPACPGGAATDVGGYTYGAFGKVAGTPEVHADGEIWSETLWDLRQALQVKTGSAADASDLAEILVTDGMRVSPPEPSMLDMRNSILVAEGADFGGALRDLVWSVFRKRGMGYFAGVTDGADTHPIEDFTSPPDPDAPTGSVTGVVTNADSGLPIAGVRVGLGGHDSATRFVPPDEFLSDETDASGRYTITGVPVGTYPKLAFHPSAGFDLEVARNVPITQDGTTVRNAAMRRDWASVSGGATFTGSDDTGADFGCGIEQALDQSQGTTWSAFNPTSPDAPPDITGPPTMTVTLPQTINVSAFLMDPSAGCGDGASATTREFKIETSSDGVTFHLAYDGTGDNEFTDDNIGLLNQLEPQGAGTNVRYVRVTMLNPLRQGDDCLPAACSGTDFIDLTEFEVLGGTPNVLPRGTLSASPSTATVGSPVTFTAHFTDPDSAIASYTWDFDGNGTTDRTTSTQTTTFAYTTTGTFAAKVTANDFRGGSASATSSVKVNAAPPPFPPIPEVSIPKRGTHGAISVPVTCFARCAISMKLVISRKLANRLGVGRTVGRKSATTRSSRTVKLKLSKKVLRAMKREKLKSITGVLTVKAEYVDGRRRLTSKKVTIRR